MYEIFIHYFKEKLEYPVGVTGFLTMNASISPHLDRIISNSISLFFGIVLIVATHFIKKWLDKKYH